MFYPLGADPEWGCIGDVGWRTSHPRHRVLAGWEDNVPIGWVRSNDSKGVGKLKSFLALSKDAPEVFEHFNRNPGRNRRPDGTLKIRELGLGGYPTWLVLQAVHCQLQIRVAVPARLF